MHGGKVVLIIESEKKPPAIHEPLYRLRKRPLLGKKQNSQVLQTLLSWVWKRGILKEIPKWNPCFEHAGITPITLSSKIRYIVSSLILGRNFRRNTHGFQTWSCYQHCESTVVNIIQFSSFHQIQLPAVAIHSIRHNSYSWKFIWRSNEYYWFGTSGDACAKADRICCFA